MPLGMTQLMGGYITKAMLPSQQQLMGIGMWGGVAAGGLLFAVQPWDFLAEAVGLKEVEEKK
eukprot:gene27780-3553_t